MSKMTRSEAGKLGNIKSQATQRKLKEERIKKYDLNPTRCLHCGKPFPYSKRHNKFCNQSCAASYNNKGKNRWEGKGKSKETNCLYCGKPLGRKQFKYCSSKCQRDYEYQEYIKRWKLGLETGMSGEYGLRKRIRRYMLEKAGYKCEKCGWAGINLRTHQSPLEVHHIDGDYRNNTEENLQVLCPNCHSLTENYKFLNKNGRKGREKYK